MISLLERSADRVVGIRVNGRVTDDAIEEVVEELEDRIERHGTIRALVHLLDLDGIEPAALVEDLKFTLKHLTDFERYAVVGDQGWLGPWVKTVGLLTPGRARHFNNGDLEEAWGWLEEDL